MPDRRKHRGKHPEDERLFAPQQLDALRWAVHDHGWLLGRGYAPDAALKLVGDRYQLTARQRTAVFRSSCSESARVSRRQRQQGSPFQTDEPIGIDGYNLLITIESALAGGLILIGADGCYRDLASVHGTYRKVEETMPAVTIIFEHLAAWDIRRVDWYLDRPVSNSGRLKAAIADHIERSSPDGAPAARCNIELLDDPDRRLAAYEGIVVTTDSAVLDRCPRWLNLAAEIVKSRIGCAWTVDLRSPPVRDPDPPSP